MHAGENCGILCKNLRIEYVQRGMWMVTPGSVKPTNIVKVEFYMMTEEESGGGRKEGIRPGYNNRIFCTTWDKGGRIFFNNELLMPGEYTTGYLVFDREVPLKKGSKFTMHGKQDRAIGYGIVSQLFEPEFIDAKNKFDFEVFLKRAKPYKENDKI